MHQYFQILPLEHYKYMNRILNKRVISDHLKEEHEHLKELAYLQEALILQRTEQDLFKV